MVLHITATNSNLIQFQLESEKKLVHTKLYSVAKQPTLLAVFHSFLQECTITPQQINRVLLQINPVLRFSTIRSITTLANALAFGLQIPVNEKKFALPVYNKEPNIT